MRVGWDGNGPGSASRIKAAKGQDPKSAAGWTIVRPGCAAERRSGPKLRHLQDVSRWNGPCQSAELPWAAGQHGGTGRKGRTAAARVSIASTAGPHAHSAERPRRSARESWLLHVHGMRIQRALQGSETSREAPWQPAVGYGRENARAGDAVSSLSHPHGAMGHARR